MPLPHKEYYTAGDFYKMPEDVRAELIDGQIYDMAAPDSLHQAISGELHLVIGNYIKGKGGKCRIFAAPFDVQLNEKEDTVLEPDLTVICDRGKITRHGCVGAPDWIIEIVSPSNSRHDYITKLGLYSDAGVKEYWIVDAERQRISVYNFEITVLIANVYTFDAPIKVGIYEDLTINFKELDLEL